MEEIGWNTRLIELTEQQVLTLIEVAVGGFQDAMRETASERRARRCRSDARLQPRLKFADHVNAVVDDGARRRERRPSAARLSRRLAPRASLASGRCSSSLPARPRTTARSSPAARCASSASATRSRISRSAGCAAPASISTPARAIAPTASSSASRSPAGASAATSTASSPPRPKRSAWRVPALWECKTMNARNWRETVSKGVAVAKPVYAAQIALYQAYMDAGGSGHRRPTRRCSPPSTRTPPSSTTSWCRSTPRWRSA